MTENPLASKMRLYICTVNGHRKGRIKNEKTGEDTFSFPANISDTQQYKLFGNAVTIPVIKELAETVLEILKKQ